MACDVDMKTRMLRHERYSDQLTVGLMINMATTDSKWPLRLAVYGAITSGAQVLVTLDRPAQPEEETTNLISCACLPLAYIGVDV